ncbi:MAG: hypothetical protein WDN06_11855 [Asticcacaulis sp.]
MGARVGNETLVNTTTAGNQDHPSISALADGGFVVAWQDVNGGIYEKVFATGPINGDGDANVLEGTKGADKINGLGGADTLHGLAGNDTLDGGTGNDAMFGGAGNDTYIVDAAGDTASEQAVAGIDDGGTDEARASVSFHLGAFVENLTLIGSGNISGTGNELANRITRQCRRQYHQWRPWRRHHGRRGGRRRLLRR